MRIGVPRETHAGEKRIATTPDVATQLIKLGFSVAIEENAGAAASYSNEAYEAAGCDIVASHSDVWAESDVILKVRAPDASEVKRLNENQTLICFLWPGQNPDLLKQLT
ncbi:MAG: NAD(P)(+) transhydrogenase (Re/Si-specific) subunit alpha, partial [Proteobacteria bacterium]|nr:NAD(P)(+) transhydrogenase (Re/Si-specific) subunit alpha [Pseudomonadota bacterium]